MAKIAVIGAGLMGSGIAQVAAVAGYDVVLRDVDRDGLDRAIASIGRSLEKFVAKDQLDLDEAETALARIQPATDIESVGDAELVVEAVFERLEVKQKVFATLDKVCAAGTILATNTSAIPVTRIAAATSRPEWVIGMHFFSPVPLMRLCELVRGFKTTDQTLAGARTFAEAIGKTVVVVNRDVAGFVTTRLLTAFIMEAVRLVESGVATAQDVDAACRLGFGHPMGPLATADLTGIDILRNATENIWAETRDPKFAPPEMLTRMVVAGDLGRKTGRGFYDYDS